MAVFGRDWNTPIPTFPETSVQRQYHAFYSWEIPRHQASSWLDSLAFELENVDAASMDTSTATLLRWLTGPRFSALPIKSADHPVPKLSFEFSPPRTEALEQQLWTCIERLAPLVPRFVSVTYGAGGSTQARTHATVARIAREG